MIPIFRPTINPAVTAGLMWHPEMWPMLCAIVATVSPKAREIRTTSPFDWNRLIALVFPALLTIKNHYFLHFARVVTGDCTHAADLPIDIISACTQWIHVYKVGESFLRNQVSRKLCNNFGETEEVVRIWLQIQSKAFLKLLTLMHAPQARMTRNIVPMNSAARALSNFFQSLASSTPRVGMMSDIAILIQSLFTCKRLNMILQLRRFSLVPLKIGSFPHKYYVLIYCNWNCS